MKIAELSVRDLDRFIDYLISHGFSVVRGSHAVLLDHSELENLRVLRDGDLVAVIVSHYISQYYRAEYMGLSSDDAYLEELLRIKHSSERWRIPVNPLIIIAFDSSFIGVAEDYGVDDYPVHDGASLVEHYRRENPRYSEIPKILLARILEGLRAGLS